MAADLLVVLLLVLMLEMLMVLLYKVVLMMLDPVLVLSSSSVLYDVHRLQVLERVALARVGGAVEGGRLQED